MLFGIGWPLKQSELSRSVVPTTRAFTDSDAANYMAVNDFSNLQRNADRFMGVYQSRSGPPRDIGGRQSVTLLRQYHIGEQQSTRATTSAQTSAGSGVGSPGQSMGGRGMGGFGA